METIKKNVTDQVYDNLMRMLLTGKYAPGDKLPSENELTEQYGASRNTIRSALTRMNALGLVETRRGEGTFFKSVGAGMYLREFLPSILTSENDLMGLMMVRRGLEISAARLAAIHATAEDIAGMEAYFRQLKTQSVDNHAFAETTNDFHQKIALASKNELIAQMLEMIGWIITNRMADFLTYKPDVEDSIYYHNMVFLCIRQHKPDEAAFMMDCHMKLLIDRVQEYTQYCESKKHMREHGSSDHLTVSYTFREEQINDKSHPRDHESHGPA